MVEKLCSLLPSHVQPPFDAWTVRPMARKKGLSHGATADVVNAIEACPNNCVTCQANAPTYGRQLLAGEISAYLNRGATCLALLQT